MNISEKPVTPSPDGYCPDGYQDVYQESNYCYKIVADKDRSESWGAARRMCVKDGADLATFHSQEEVKHVFHALQYEELSSWIGLLVDSKSRSHF